MGDNDGNIDVEGETDGRELGADEGCELGARLLVGPLEGMELGFAEMDGDSDAGRWVIKEC